MKGNSVLSEFSRKEKVWSGVLSVFTLFAVLSTVAPNWYGQMPLYEEWICGLTTWSGYNKQADMQVIQSILLGLPVLFLCFGFLFSFWKRKIKVQDKDRTGLFFIGSYLLVLAFIFARKQYAFLYLAIWAILLLGYILVCISEKTENAAVINGIFGKLIVGTLYLNLAVVSLLLFGNAFVPGIGAYWQNYAVVSIFLEALLFLLLCGIKSLRKWSPFLCILQLILPLAWVGFAHFRFRYEKDGALMELFYSGRWKWFCFGMCGILLVCFILAWRRKKSGQETEIFFSTFLMTAVLRVFSQPDGILNIDYFHNGEISMPMQQLVSYGKLPYEDLIPIHGMCDYFYGVINYLFFDGTYLSLNAAKIVGNLVMAMVLATVIYFFVENRWQGILLVYCFMPFMIQTAGMRYLFVFILFLVLFSSRMEKGMESLYAWVLLSILAIGWNAAIGGAVALAFLPVIVYRGKRDIPRQIREIGGQKKTVTIAGWLFLFMIGIAFIPLFLQIVVYLKDNTGTTLYVNGMEMLEEVSQAASYFVPEIIGEQGGFFLTAFGFFLPLIVSFAIFVGNKKTGAGEFFVTLLFGLGLLANYSFVRYDEGLRSRVLGIFFLVLLAVTLLYRQMKREWEKNQNQNEKQNQKNDMWILYLVFWAVALFLADDSPLITSDTLAFEQKVPTYVNTVIRGQEVEDPVVYVSGDSVAMPNLGTGFIQGNTLASLQNVQKVLASELADGKTCFDVTNGVANAVIFDIPVYLPFTSAYNISNATMQAKAISMLENNLPDVILAAPYIQFDEASFSFRSMELYRYLMKQGYVPYKYENVIYLVRGEKRLQEAEEDWEAFAQLMHKANLSYLPAVWGANMQNVKETTPWETQDINAQLVATEAGFDVIFTEPVSGKDMDMLLLEGITFNETAKGRIATDESAAEKPEISMWLESSIASEDAIEYRFTLRQDCGGTYILPVCNSPYFTEEEAIEKLSFTYDSDLAIPVEKIKITACRLQ